MTMLETSANLVELRTLAEVARQIRIDVLEMITRAKSSHLGSAYSIVDLLTVLYGVTLRVDPANPEAPDRDRFILSKAHAGAALYATLARFGFFQRYVLESYYRDGGQLAGHADSHGVPGVEVSAGALGHGLAIGVGMALAAKRDGSQRRTVVLMSDGECDEGSVWEAALFASSFDLDNLTCIVDYNKLQGMGFVRDVIKLDPLAAKWEAFGWAAREISGHDILSIRETLAQLPFDAGKPSVIIAHTVKGRGVSFMENELLWHYRTPDAEEYQRARTELENAI